MIPFACPHCGKRLKVSEERAGLQVLCHRCGKPCVAPAAAPAGSDSPVERPPRQQPNLRQGLFQGMSQRVRWAVGLVTAVGTLSLLLPVVGGLPETVTPWALPVTILSLLLLLAILHGHATGCPACGRWWSRTEIEKALVDREVFDKDGFPVARCVSRSTYECGGCRHRWSVMDGEKDQKPAHGRPSGI